MAKVTGYTAERMKTIEDETVVDGEVVDDNLHLLTREGTVIDAGNVRGPQGIQGVPGPVQSINNETGNVYSPRIFDNKTLLDLWVTVPNGAYAFTTVEKSFWIRQEGAWVPAPPQRIFSNKAALDAGWPPGPAPEGSTAVTLDDRLNWQKDASGWLVNDGVRVFATTAERDTRWPNPPDGAQCSTITPHTLWRRKGTVWFPVAGQLPAVTLLKGDQAVSPNVWTTVNWTAVKFNIGNFCTWTSNGVYFPFRGVYHVSALIKWVGGTWGSTWILSIMNQGGYAYFEGSNAFTATWGPSLMLGGVIDVNANDYVQVLVYQNTGGNQTMQGASGIGMNCSFSIAMKGLAA